MTTALAIEWLEDEFISKQETCDFLTTPGPAVIKPMIQFRSVMETGKGMTIGQADYHDPDRWWL